jgi:hypothetical protein
VLGAAALVALTTCAALHAQQNALELNRRVAGELAQFADRDWNVRARAFYSLLSLSLPDGFNGRTWLMRSILADLFKDETERREDVSLALIRLLDLENGVRRSDRNPRSEEYSNYFGDLLAAVAALHDARALDGLLLNITTGNIATKGVAALGPASLDRILEIIALDDSGGGAITAQRMGATRALSQMLDADIVNVDDAGSRSRIRAALIRAARDKQPWVRLNTVEGLARLSDRDAILILRTLAESDPFSRPGESGRPAIYPVRDAARRALDSKPLERK